VEVYIVKGRVSGNLSSVVGAYIVKGRVSGKILFYRFLYNQYVSGKINLLYLMHLKFFIYIKLCDEHHTKHGLGVGGG
jgi:hypothetical protein